MHLPAILLAIIAAAGIAGAQSPIKVFDEPAGAAAASLEMAREPVSSHHNVMIAYTTKDPKSVRLVLCNDDFTAAVEVASFAVEYGELDDGAIGYAAGAKRWIVAFRDSGHLAVYLHDFANLSPNSGTKLTLPLDWFVKAMVGSTSGSTALVTFTRGVKIDGAFNSARHDAVPVHAETPAFGAIFPVVSHIGAWLPFLPTSPYARFCGLTPVGDGAVSTWVFAWAGRSSPDSIHAVQLRANGAVSPTSTIVPIPPGSVAGRLRVAGGSGRYLLTYSTGHTEVAYRRFDWPENAFTATPLNAGFLGLNSATGHRIQDLAFDRTTDSHWMASWTELDSNKNARAAIAKIAADGAVIEQHTVWQKVGESAALTFDSKSGCFPVVYRSPSRTSLTGHAIWAKTYCNESVSFGYGIACAGNLAADMPPVAGTAAYTVRLENAPPGVAAFLSLGHRRTALDLSPFGMTGCTEYVDGITSRLPVTTDRLGRAEVSFPIPSSFRGDLFAQWTFAYPDAPWRTKSATTQGLEMRVR